MVLILRRADSFGGIAFAIDTGPSTGTFQNEAIRVKELRIEVDDGKTAFALSFRYLPIYVLELRILV